MKQEYVIPACTGKAIDVRLGVAACSVSESSCNGGKCSSIMIEIED